MDVYGLAWTYAIILLCIIQYALGVVIGLYLSREIKAIWNQFTPVEPNNQDPEGCSEEKTSTTSQETGEFTFTLDQLQLPVVLQVCELRRYSFDGTPNIFTPTDHRCSKKIVLCSISSPQRLAR